MIVFQNDLVKVEWNESENWVYFYFAYDTLMVRTMQMTDGMVWNKEEERWEFKGHPKDIDFKKGSKGVFQKAILSLLKMDIERSPNISSE